MVKLDDTYELTITGRRNYGDTTFVWFSVFNTKTKQNFSQFDPYESPLDNRTKEVILRIVKKMDTPIVKILE